MKPAEVRRTIARKAALARWSRIKDECEPSGPKVEGTATRAILKKGKGKKDAHKKVKAGVVGAYGIRGLHAPDGAILHADELVIGEEHPNAVNKNKFVGVDGFYIPSHLVQAFLRIVNVYPAPQTTIEKYLSVPWTKGEQDEIRRVQGRAAKILRDLGILAKDEKIELAVQRPAKNVAAWQSSDWVMPFMFKGPVLPVKRYRLVARILLIISSRPRNYKSPARIVRLVKEIADATGPDSIGGAEGASARAAEAHAARLVAAQKK